MNETAPARALSIGELAGLAGTTTRAVRHYHSIGLLPEPERDAAGYRRYAAGDLIALVRVVRLRTLGMPTRVIAQRLRPGQDDEQSLPKALTELAAEIDEEIESLMATRQRVLDLAASDAFDQPVAAVTSALRGHGLLGEADELGSAEEWLVTVMDALAPSGVTGALNRADRVLDGAAGDAAGELLERFRALDENCDDEQIAELARAVTVALPRKVRWRTGAAIDFTAMDRLLAGELSAPQLRFLHHLDTFLSARRGTRS